MSYKNLEVWKLSRKLVAFVYQVTASYPKDEMFGLTGQMRRAAVSIACNIAEGYRRRSPASYAHFLQIAKGSVNELETLFILSEDLGLVEGVDSTYADLAKVGSMLSNLIGKIQSGEGAGTDNLETVEVFRPVGPVELELLKDSEFRQWPPRLPEQPIFYPVTNERYAAEITKQWNVTDFNQGFVTRFQVRQSFMENYPIHCVGAPHHQEWWIPAEELEELNRNIVGPIEVIGSFQRE